MARAKGAKSKTSVETSILAGTLRVFELVALVYSSKDSEGSLRIGSPRL